MHAQGSTAKVKPEATPQAKRPARVLLGWLSSQEAALMQGGREVQAGRRLQDISEQQLARARRARDAVASRPPGVDQAGIVQGPPEALGDHVAELYQHPVAAQLLRDGWQPGLVDLSRVCATQAYVYTDDAVERTMGVSADDPAALAKVTLSPTGGTSLRATFDPRKQAFVFSSRNPNLRVVDRFEQQIEPGVAGYGFVVRVVPSFLLVAGVNGRYILRDGYHRAYGMLKRGINVVPALVRDFEKLEDISVPAGMLPHDVFLGDRPPRLCDYLDESVTAEVQLPAAEKIVIVQGLELGLVR
jgi:hypothetical protein